MGISDSHPPQYRFSYSEAEWENLLPLLRTRVARWVAISRHLYWTRQPSDIIDDIVSESLVRVIIYVKRVEAGLVREINSLERIAEVIAYHCYMDAFRRDGRLLPLPSELEELARDWGSRGDAEPEDRAVDNIHYEWVFMRAARWISDLPEKQRAALLTDLANRMDFDPYESTPLQEALASVGIDMREYQKPLPSDRQERARYAALLSVAYKRLALLAYLQYYTLVAS